VVLGGNPGDRKKGLLRLEGKEYIVNNGQVTRNSTFTPI